MNKTVVVKGTGFNDISTLVSDLPAREGFEAGDTVTLDFAANQFVFLTGLVLLATWRKSLASGVAVKVDDHLLHPTAQALLTNSGFREILETGHETPSVQRRSGKLPLRPLTNRLGKEATVQEVTSILEDQLGSSRDLTPFSTLLSEVCENALTHSEFASPGYVSARVMERDGTLELAVCDSGIGFRDSYLAGTNEELKERIRRGANPIEIAVQGLNSSKPIRMPGSNVSYYGFGLFITRRLVEENRGRLMIVSGKDVLHIERGSQRHHEAKSAFHGTFVCMVLDLSAPLPLEKIYSEATDLYIPASVSKPTQVESAASAIAPSLAAPKPIDTNNEVSGESLVELRHFGTELLTRETGLAIRAEIATKLLSFEVVAVNLDGVTDVTPSVADEAFGKLAVALGQGIFEKAIRFEGGSSLVNRLIEFVLKTRASKST
jgi:hypothetical protein